MTSCSRVKLDLEEEVDWIKVLTEYFPSFDDWGRGVKGDQDSGILSDSHGLTPTLQL